METAIGRAFLSMQMSHEERVKVRAYERSGTLPEGQCLTGFEICRLLRLKPGPVPDADRMAMEAMRRDYERKVLWKRRQIEEKQHETACRKACQCQSAAAEMHDWEDWAIAHYGVMESAA